MFAGDPDRIQNVPLSEPQINALLLLLSREVLDLYKELHEYEKLIKAGKFPPPNGSVFDEVAPIAARHVFDEYQRIRKILYQFDPKTNPAKPKTKRPRNASANRNPDRRGRKR